MYFLWMKNANKRESQCRKRDAVRRRRYSFGPDGTRARGVGVEAPAGCDEAPW